MFEVLYKYLSKPSNEIRNTNIVAGQKVKFSSEVEESLIEYYNEYKLNPEANEKWLKIGQILTEQKNKSFSLLHIADQKSAYPIGTAIIEIGPNLDLELRADALITEVTN